MEGRSFELFKTIAFTVQYAPYWRIKKPLSACERGSLVFTVLRYAVVRSYGISLCRMRLGGFTVCGYTELVSYFKANSVKPNNR